MTSKPRKTGRAATAGGGSARRKSARKAAARTPADATQIALAAFAHEVRTPLTGILAVSDLLATSGLDERERRWAETIKAAAEHLSSLTTLFVDAARTPHGKLVVQHDTFDLPRFVASLGDALAARAEAKGLTAHLRLPKALPQHVTGDVVRLRAALENLIDNAVKFTETGDVSLTLRRAPAANNKLLLTFEIADRGIGLTSADIKKLFRPFSQASLAIAQRFGGAGLGLSSARLFARAVGGGVTAAPRKRGGAVFTLTAVTTRVATAAPTTPHKSQPANSRPAAPLRVLAVEDNPYGRVVLNAILTELGHRAEFAGRGEEALDWLTTHAFDVVLMDMVLPGLGGIKTIERIRARGKATKRIAIIGVSGRANDESAARAAGADAFLVKPVAPRLLAQTIAEAMKKRKRT